MTTGDAQMPRARLDSNSSVATLGFSESDRCAHPNDLSPRAGGFFWALFAWMYPPRPGVGARALTLDDP